MRQNDINDNLHRTHERKNKEANYNVHEKKHKKPHNFEADNASAN